jgi:tetratricopeptide (TPR) repeat protein
MPSFENLLIGALLSGRYRVLSTIGRGSMGVVYRAVDERLARPVAVKVISSHAAAPRLREQMRSRFHREARAAARLHHPNVVSIFDFGTDATNGLDFLVMELLAGEDLSTRLDRVGRLGIDESTDLIRQAARGLAAGHRAGLVHRDVKPANLFLAVDPESGLERVRLLDFGIALPIDSAETLTHLTEAGSSPLTPAYGAPELHRGEGRITPASGIFSLGVVAHQMLTGRRPFTAEQISAFRSAGVSRAEPITALLPELPPHLAAAIDRALTFDPLHRFATGADFLDALEVEEDVPSAPATNSSRPRFAPLLPRIVQLGRAIGAAFALPRMIRNRRAVIATLLVAMVLASLPILSWRGFAFGEPATRSLERCREQMLAEEGRAPDWRVVARVCGRAGTAGDLDNESRVMALENRLEALTQLGRHRHSVDAARDLLRLRPASASAYLQLGESLHLVGNYEEALWAFEQSNRIVPSGETHLKTAATLSALDRHGDAYRHMEIGQRLDPSLALRADYQQRLGSLLFYLGRHEEALVAHRRVTELLPDWLDGWGNLGLAANLTGRHAEAVGAYEEALARDPSYFESRPDQRGRWIESKNRIRR